MDQICLGNKVYLSKLCHYSKQCLLCYASSLIKMLCFIIRQPQRRNQKLIKWESGGRHRGRELAAQGDHLLAPPACLHRKCISYVFHAPIFISPGCIVTCILLMLYTNKPDQEHIYTPPHVDTEHQSTVAAAAALLMCCSSVDTVLHYVTVAPPVLPTTGSTASSVSQHVLCQGPFAPQRALVWAGLLAA